MSRVTVKPELMRWARERSGIPPEVLMKHFPKFEQWEREELRPTLRQLESLAKKTLTPLGYFFLPEPPEDKLPIPDFRTLGDNVLRRPSPNLLETVQTMQRRQIWMREYLIEQGARPLSFVTSVEMTTHPYEVAVKIREVLGLSEDWARHLVTWSDALRTLRVVMEKEGILPVFNGVVGNNVYRKLDVNEFRGFILCDEYAPLIFVNGADVKAAQMFTVVHELAHLWLGQAGVFNLRELQPADNDVERFCNMVAAEFLVPEKEIVSIWATAKREEEPFQYLARYFKVSPLVTARRALDLGFLSRSAFFDFYNEYIEDSRRRAAAHQGGGDFYANLDMRLGRRFAETVVRAAAEGKLLYREAYQLTGLNSETFDRYSKAFKERHQ
jgi:Zn-dependent peptidase ImmA (M78 family)